MKKNYSEWLKDLNDESQEEIENIIIDGEYEEIAEFEIGFSDEENVWDGYKNKGYMSYSKVYKISDVYLVDPVGDFKEEDMIVFDDKELAIEEASKYKDTGCWSIEKQIENFFGRLGDYKNRVDVSPKAEYNSGYFYSFNIDLDGDLFVDGIFSLDGEELKKDIESFDLLKEEVKKEYGINIDKIYKEKDGFQRYYNISFSNQNSSTEKQINISGFLQGKTKKIVDFIKDEIDFGDVLSELK